MKENTIIIKDIKSSKDNTKTKGIVPTWLVNLYTRSGIETIRMTSN